MDARDDTSTGATAQSAPKTGVRTGAVVWDWDNTLVDTAPAIFHTYRMLFGHYDLNPPGEEEMARMMSPSGSDWMDGVFGEGKEEAHDIYLRLYIQNAKDVKLFPGAIEALETLERMGVTQAVVSSKTGDILRNEAKTLGIAHFFHNIIGAWDADKDKPDVAPLNMALEGVNYGKLAVIGDGPGDMALARNAGATAILIGAPLSDSALKPDYWFPSLQDLTAAIPLSGLFA